METAYIIRNGVIIGSGTNSSLNPDSSSTYIINCTVAMESDGTVIVENYDGDFTKTQQTIADGGKVELRTNFNSSNYILEPSRIEENYVTFNTIDKNANITIKVTEYGINDVSYIDLNSSGGSGTTIDDDVISTDTTWSSEKIASELGRKTYTSLAELGLTTPSTVGEVFMAMPEKSMLMLNVEALVDDGANVLTVTDVPAEYGVLTIDKWSNSRFRIEFNTSREGSSTNIKQWIGTLKGTDGTGLKWKELATMDNAIETIANPTELDTNKFLKSGYYSLGDARDRTNLPIQRVGTLLVFNAGYYIIQEYILNENQRAFMRKSIDKGTNWSAWTELATMDKLGGLTFSVSGKTLTITNGTNTWTLVANS